MTNLDNILKSRHYFPDKGQCSQIIIFPVAKYGCESWTIKKAEHWKTDAFELWCWRRLLRVPWAARRYNQSILEKISPEYSLKGLMLKLKLQYAGHLIWRTDSLEKTLILGKIEGGRRRGWQRIRCQYWNQIDHILAAKDGEALYSQQKQDWKLTVAQILNSLLPNSGEIPCFGVKCFKDIN